MTAPPNQEELDETAFLVSHAVGRPTIQQARTLYLFGPGHVHYPMLTLHVRTSLDAALTDARKVVGRNGQGVIEPGHEDGSRAWIGASGYLMLIDQLQNVFDYGDFEGLLRSELAGLGEDAAGAIYGLRNAFIHNYGLANEADGRSEATRRRRRHAFSLKSTGERLVIVGDRADVLTRPIGKLPRTVVDLRCLGDLVEAIVREIRRRHLTGETLLWRVDDVEEFQVRSFFEHQDPIERSG